MVYTGIQYFSFTEMKVHFVEVVADGDLQHIL